MSDQQPLFRRSSARELLPRTVTYLGELGAMVLRNPQTGKWYAINEKPDRALFCDANGRTMYVLTPEIKSTVKPAAPEHRQAIRALKLHERFMHRQADALYNCVVPAFRAPRYCGELMVIEYYAAKDIDFGDDDEDDDEDAPTLYEHYFEQPGVAPAPAQLWQVGRSQYLIPPGPWRVSDRGIEFAAPKAA